MSHQKKDKAQLPHSEHDTDCENSCNCGHDHSNSHTSEHEAHSHTEVGCGCGHDLGGEKGEVFERIEFISMLVGAALFAVGIICGADAALGRILLTTAMLPLGWILVFGAARNVRRGNIFDENLLMLIAAVGALVLGETAEAAAVLLFYRVGEWLQGRAEGSSRRSIAALTGIRPDTANLLRGSEITVVAPREVAVGELILIKPGERVPLDGTVEVGASTLDTSALTGEAVPREVTVGNELLSGCVNLTGVLTVRVTTPYGDSTVEKILKLVESASSRKAPTEQFITKFARVYTPAVVALAALIALVPPLVFDAEFAVWVKQALILLVISCPCALVVSVPLAFFGGIGAASRRGILVKGGNYLDALCTVEAVAFDKTGTLTRGEFRIAGVFPADGFTDSQLLQIAAAAESLSAHPIARCIAATQAKDAAPELSNYSELAGRGVSATVGSDAVLAGNAKLLADYTVAIPTGIDSDTTTVLIAVNGSFAGHITVEDTPRPDAERAVATLNSRGIRTVMLTGDNQSTAETVAGSLGITELHAELLPAGKVAVIEQISAGLNAKAKVAFLGDGINDAPVLARADIGIAMGGLGSDAALEAADVVLMTDEPSKLCDAIDIAKYTRKIVLQNIILSLGVKLAVMVLGVAGIAGMWSAVFADVGVSLLAVLNSARVIRRFR